MYTQGIKDRINMQIHANSDYRDNKYLHYYKDESGATHQERFYLVHTNVAKGTSIQNQVTIPVDKARFGTRVTIRWWSEKPTVCQVALVKGGGKQNGIAPNPFSVLECGTYEGTWHQLMPMVCERILNLRKETNK